MKNKNTGFIFAILVGVLVLAGVAYYFLGDKYKQNNLKIESSSSGSSVSGSNSSSDKKSILPDFKIKDVNGNEVSLHSKFGKPIVLNIWATWCGPCKVEMPYFQKAYEKYSDKIEFIMLNATTTRGETEEKVKSFIDERKFTFPIYYDANGEALRTLGIRAFPSTFLLSSEGEILAATAGAVAEENLMEALKLLIQY